MNTALTGAQVIAFCADIHAGNVAAGWWSDPRTGDPLKRNVGELLMLCVSEVCEGADGLAGNLMDDKLPKRQMIEVELADFNIRLFDLGGGLGIADDLGQQFDSIRQGGAIAEFYGHLVSPDAYLLRIIRFVSEAMEHDRKGRRAEMARPLAFALHGVVILAEILDLDVMAAQEEKRLFNANRADHKLENRLAPGGKAY